MALSTDYMKLTRRVIVGDDMSVEIQDIVDSPYFEVELTPPPLRSASRPGPPQTTALYTVRYWKSPVAFYLDPLMAGDRFEAAGAEWEVLMQARDILTGMRQGIQLTQAIQVRYMYPVSASLEELGGEVLDPQVPIAIWSPSEDHRDTGNYRDFAAQVPIDYQGSVFTNKQVTVGGQSFKVVESNVNREEMHIDLTIRSAGLRP